MCAFTGQEIGIENLKMYVQTNLFKDIPCRFVKGLRKNIKYREGRMSEMIGISLEISLCNIRLSRAKKNRHLARKTLSSENWSFTSLG